MRLWPAPFLLLSLISAAAQTAPTPPQTTGSTGTGTYRDDVLRLSYSYPADYVDATSMVGPAFEASLGQDPAASAEAKCISIPFSRMAAGKKDLSIVLLVHASAGCMKKKFNARSVAESAQQEVQSIAASGGKPNFRSPVSFSLAGRPATLMQGSFALPTGQSMQAMVVCVLDQPDMACWQFLSQNTATLGALSAYQVTFDGSPATPLVPAGLLIKP